jgi:hypothetical protein
MGGTRCAGCQLGSNRVHVVCASLDGPGAHDDFATTYHAGHDNNGSPYDHHNGTHNDDDHRSADHRCTDDHNRASQADYEGCGAALP